MAFEPSAIVSRVDLVAFVEADDYRADPERWENDDLPSFLDALSRWPPKSGPKTGGLRFG